MTDTVTTLPVTHMMNVGSACAPRGTGTQAASASGSVASATGTQAGRLGLQVLTLAVTAIHLPAFVPMMGRSLELELAHRTGSHGTASATVRDSSAVHDGTACQSRVTAVELRVELQMQYK